TPVHLDQGLLGQASDVRLPDLYRELRQSLLEGQSHMITVGLPGQKKRTPVTRGPSTFGARPPGTGSMSTQMMGGFQLCGDMVMSTSRVMKAETLSGGLQFRCAAIAP